MISLRNKVFFLSVCWFFSLPLHALENADLMGHWEGTKNDGTLSYALLMINEDSDSIFFESLISTGLKKGAKFSFTLDQIDCLPLYCVVNGLQRNSGNEWRTLIISKSGIGLTVLDIAHNQNNKPILTTVYTLKPIEKLPLSFAYGRRNEGKDSHREK